VSKTLVSAANPVNERAADPGSESFEMVTGLLPKNAARKLDGERTSLPGQHPLATVKEACAPQICSVSIIRPR
jgi:hypothetical protein